MEAELNYSDRYPDCVWTDISLLKNFMKDVFIKLGTPPDQAETVAEVLITADRKGIDSHGIGRFKPIYIDRIEQGTMNTVTVIDIVKETDTTAVIDGNNGLGHVVSKKAVEIAIEKARLHGTGMTVV